MPKVKKMSKVKKKKSPDMNKMGTGVSEQGQMNKDVNSGRKKKKKASKKKAGKKK